MATIGEKLGHALAHAVGKAPEDYEPMPTSISPDQVREDRLPRVTAIFKNFELLRAILDRHEAMIHKRWLKKTKEQRRTILLEAWGSQMSASHRSDLENVRSGRYFRERTDINDREAFVWPFINQEDLTKPRNLLYFLAARARHHSGVFAFSDIQAIRPGTTFGTTSPFFLNGYLMQFMDGADVFHYGELHDFEELRRRGVDGSITSDLLVTPDRVSISEGMLILEAQEKSMSFLVACAQKILHHIPSEKILQFPHQVEPTSTLDSSSSGEDNMVSLRDTLRLCKQPRRSTSACNKATSMSDQASWKRRW